MSAFDSKLEASQPTQGIFRITSMGKEEIWKRISGRGESAVFEQVS